MGIISSHLSTKQFSNSYLLYGEQAYLRSYYKKALTYALTDPDDTLNYAYFEGKDTDPDEVAELVETMPFMAEHRVVVVENSGWLAKAGGSSESDEEEPAEEVKGAGKTARLQEAIKNMGEDVILILVEEKADKRSKLYKAMAAKGCVEEFPQYDNDDEPAKWIARRAKAEGSGMDANTAYYLVSEVGRDFMMLDNELMKLVAYTLDRGVITKADVDEVCSHQVSTKIFDMVNAMVAHKQEAALRLYYDLLTLREAPFHILALIERQYNQMLQVKDALNNNKGTGEICSGMGIQQWQAKRIIDSVRNVKVSTIRKYLEECCKADEAIKTGNLTDMMSVELLIVSCSKLQQK